MIIQKHSTVEAANHGTIKNKAVEERSLNVNQYFIEQVESERREEQAGDLLKENGKRRKSAKRRKQRKS